MPPVIPPTIDTLPPAPDRGDDSSIFVPEAAAFAGALDPFGQQIAAAATATYQNALAALEAATDLEGAADAVASASNLFARSTSTLTMAPGSKTIHFQAPATGFAASDQIVALLRSDPTIRMFMTVDTFDGSDDMTATVVSGGIVGSGGPYSNWLIMHAAFLTPGASAADILAEVTEGAAETPKAVADARTWKVLTDAATVTPNGLNGRNFTWTPAGSRLLAPIANCKVNQIYRIWFTKASGGVLAWASCYQRVGGLPVLPATNGQYGHLEIRILAVDGSGTCTAAVCTYVSNPTNA